MHTGDGYKGDLQYDKATVGRVSAQEVGNSQVVPRLLSLRLQLRFGNHTFARALGRIVTEWRDELIELSDTENTHSVYDCFIRGSIQGAFSLREHTFQAVASSNRVAPL